MRHPEHVRETIDGEGLRARKKRQTREAIALAAAQLFAQRGYDLVRVTEVAAAADVSEQTVYNYFPTKEDLVFDRSEEFGSAIIAMIADRGPGVSVIDSVRGAVSWFIDGAVRSPHPGGMPRLLAQSPALRRSWLDLTDRIRGDLAARLALESQGALPQVVADVLAGSVMAVFTAIVDELGRLGDGAASGAAELSRSVTVALDRLESGLDPGSAPGRRSPSPQPPTGQLRPLDE